MPGRFLVVVLLTLSLFRVHGQSSCDVQVVTTGESCAGSGNGTAKVVVNGQGSGSPAGCLTAGPADASYSTGCTSTYSNSSTGDVLVGPGQQVCLTATSFTGGIQVTGGTLVISGSATPSYLNINGNNPTFTLIVLPGATAQFSSLNLFGSSTVKNYGTLKMQNSVGFNGTLENNGTLTVTGDLSINAPYGNFLNKGSVTISSNFNNYNASTNGGTLAISGILNNNSGSTLTNLCTITVGGDLNNNTKIINQGRITVGATSHMNGSSTYQGYAGAVYTSVNTTIDGLVQGMSSACSSIKVSGSTTINGSAVFSGAIDYCDANGIETNTGTFAAPASKNCSCSAVSASYAWQSPLSGTSDHLTNLSAGSYSVLVSASGCTAVTKTFTISAPAALTAVVTPNGLSASAAVSGGTAPYSYSWSGSQSTQSTVSYAVSGTYTVTVRDANGCSTAQSFTVTAPTTPPAGGCDVTVQTRNPTCAGAGDGSATIYLNGSVLGTGSSGSGSNAPAGCSAAQTSSYSCTGGCTQTITDNNAGVNVAAGQQVCLTATAYTGNINVTGGTLVICGKATPQNINYNTNGAAFTLIVNGELTLSSLNLPASCTLKNYGKVTFTGSVSFNGTVYNYGTLLAGGDFNNNASTGTFYNYSSLSVAGNLNCNVTGVNNGTLQITGNLQNNGGATFTNNCTIQVSNELINNAAFANNGNIRVAHWTRLNGGSTTTLGAGTTLSTQSLTLDGTVTGAGSSCSALQVSGQSIVNGSGKLQGNVSMCDSSPDGTDTFTGTVVSPASRNCSCILQPVQYSSPLQGMSNPYQGLPAGTYTVNVQAQGCPAVSKTFTITDPAPVTAGVSVSGKTATVTASGGQGTLLYTWDGVSSSSASHTYVNDGAYQVTVSDSKNCSKTITFHIPVQSTADSSCSRLLVEYPSPTQVRITCVCAVSNCTILTGTTPVSTITTPVTTIPRPKQDSTVLVQIGPGTVIEVVVSGSTVNTGTGDPGSTPDPLIGNNLAVTATSTPESCAGKKDGSIQLTITGGSGDYSISNNYTTQTSGTTISNVGAGDVLVKVYDNKTGYSKTVKATVSLKQTNTYALVVNSTQPTGEAATVSVQTTGSNSSANTVMQWSTGQTGAGPVTIPAWLYSTGYISVTISENWACPQVLSLPVVTSCTTSVTPALSSVAATCYGSATGQASITNLPSGASVVWSGTPNLSTSSPVTSLPAGTYRADIYSTLSNGNKCKLGSNTVAVSQPAKIQVSVSQQTPSNPTSYTAQVSGGVSPYTYSWSTGTATATATLAGGAFYQLQVTDSKSCAQTTQLYIPPVVCGSGISLDITQLSCSSVTSGKITAGSSISGATYYWSSVPASAVTSPYNAAQTGLGEGTYLVTVSGWSPVCVSRAGVRLKKPSPLQATSKQVGSTVNILVSNGTPNYKVVWRLDNKQTDTRSDLTPGTSYTVDITDAKGCTLAYTFTYDPCSANPVKVSVKMNGTVATPQVSGGTAPYKYFWMLETAGGTPIPAGQDSAAVQNSLNGLYQLTAIDARGCKTTIQVSGPNCGLGSIGVASSAPSCATRCDGSAQLTGTIPAGAVITWDNQSVASSFVNACAGSHTVEIRNAQGCSFSENFTIAASTSACTVPPGNCSNFSVAVSPTSKLSRQCASEICHIDLLISGGTPVFNMYWTVQYSGSTTTTTTTTTITTDKPNLDNALAGSYTFYISDQNGCTQNKSVTVSGPQTALSAALKQTAVCAEHVNDIAIQVQGGSVPYSIRDISSGTGGQQYTPVQQSGNSLLYAATIHPTAAGAYQYQVSDAQGCVQVLHTTVAPVVPVVFSGAIVSSQATIDAGQQVRISAVTVSGYTPTWQAYTDALGQAHTFAAPSSAIQTITQAGTYVVAYSNGCATYRDTLQIGSAGANCQHCTGHGNGTGNGHGGGTGTGGGGTGTGTGGGKVKSVICSTARPVSITPDPGDNCENYQQIAANALAHYQYELYVAEQKFNIRNAFLQGVLGTSTESLTMNFSDNEQQYTLYYYDQSGSLVRTVPPSGVNALSADQATAAVNQVGGIAPVDGKAVAEHSYTTTYAYNSLNQLVHQDIPDHQRIDLWQTTGATATLNGGTVAAVGYGDATSGLMLANTASKAQLLTTADAGKTWQAAQNLGLGKITTISRPSATIYYAAGEKGTFLASGDAGHSWSLLPLPTSQPVKQVFFSSTVAGWIISQDGMRYNTPDGGHSWQAGSSSLQTAMGSGRQVRDVSVSGSTIWVVDNNNGIYQSTDAGSTWSSRTINAPADGQSVTATGSGFTMAGPQGTIYASTGDINSNTLSIVRTGLAQTVKQLINGNGSQRYALGTNGQVYFNGGTLTDAWSPAGPAGITSISQEGPLTVAYSSSAAYVMLNGAASGALSLNRLRYIGQNPDQSLSYVGLGSNALLPITINGITVSFPSPAYGIDPSGAFTITDFAFNAGKIVVLSSAGNVYQGSINTAINTVVIESTISTAPPSITPNIQYSGVSSFISDGAGNLYVKTTEANSKIIAYNGFAQVGQLSAATTDVALVSSSAGFVVESGQLKKFTASGGTITTTAAITIQPKGLESITTTGSKTYVAGDNGELYAAIGSGNFTYVPTVANTQSFIDAQYSGSTVQLLSATNQYTYTEGTPALTGGAAYSNARQVSNSTTEGVQVASTTAATGDAYSVDASAYPFILGADQGKMWYKASSSTAYTAAAVNILPLSGLAYASSSTIITVGQKGTILTSTDAGASWKMVYSGTGENLTGVSASGNKAVAIAATGTVLYSADAGQSWTKVTTPPAAPTGVKVTPNVVLITSGTSLYKSVNGGAGYTAETLPSTPAGTLRSVWLDADGYGFIVGDNGAAYRIKPATTTGTNTFAYTLVAGDATAGATQDDKGSGIPVQTLSAVQFSDRLTGYITGPNSLVLKTVDGGYHWKPESAGSSGTATPILAVSTDAQNGTLIGADGSVQSLNDQAEQFNSRFWYDELGRLILSQNARQFNITSYESPTTVAKGRSATNPGTVRAYSYTLYDVIGRITEVGEILTDKAITTYKNTSQVQYTAHTAFVAGAGFKHQVTGTVYDKNAIPPENFTPTYLRNRVAYTSYQQTPLKNEVQQTHYSYDVHGNVNSLLQIIQKDGQQLAKQVDYDYDLVSGKVNNVYYQKGQPDQLIHKYSYDGDNRITLVQTSTDGIIYTKEASYDYYAHGPLARTTIGENTVETENFSYTIQGWIKQVQGQAFSYALGYNATDYKAINTATSVLATPIASGRSLYNGNIASMTSNTPAIASASFQQQYTYDQLNRITSSTTPGATPATAYSTNYSYDVNGNIKTLNRYDGSGTQFDQLSYNYETKANGYQHTTNKLRWVDDMPAPSATTADIEDQAADNYSYDAIGNLIADKQEEIDTIKWTVSGKVKKVIRKAGSSKPNLEFEYDAAGQRTVKKVLKTDGTVISTYYLRDASGNVMSVYTLNTSSDDSPVISEQYLYGSSRIGVYNPVVSNTVTGRSFGRKSYELSDHLGNVRATLSDYRRLASQAQVQSATDYYPFGMVARAYSSSQQYRYGYQGQEHEDDITGGDYAFAYRLHDPRIGRFLSIDPVGNDYPWNAPYSFSENRVIDGIDLEGKEYCPLIPKFDYHGTWDDYVSAVDNGVINVLNIVPETWNSGVATVQSLNRGTYLNDLGGELKQMGAAIKNQVVADYSYTVNTPIKQQLIETGKSLVSPQTVELAVTIYAGSKIPVPGTNKGSQLKAVQTVAPKGNPSLITPSYAKIGSTGKVGENYLKTLGGRSQVFFKTAAGKGGRFVDQLVNGTAYESKVGYTTLTDDIKMQIAKDTELMATGQVKEVKWVFFESPVTGKAGASQPLLDALKKAGIKTEIKR